MSQQQNTDSLLSGASIGEMIRCCGLSHEQVAEALDVSVDTVDNWCAGRSTIRLTHFVRCLSLLASTDVSSSSLQSMTLRCLIQHGLSAEAAAKVLPPRRLPGQRVVLFLASEMNYSASLIAIGAREYLHQMGVELVFISASPGDREPLHSILDFVTGMDLYGVLIAPAFANLDLVRRIAGPVARSGVPVVALYDRDGLGAFGQRFVSVDDFGVGYTAGKHLVNRGHERIGFFGLDPNWSCATHRFEGLEQATAEAGLSLGAGQVFWTPVVGANKPQVTVFDEPSLLRAAVAVSESLAGGYITGVFCAQQTTTTALVDAMREHDLTHDEIRRDIVGVTLTSGAHIMKGVRVSYVVIPAREMGRQGARILTMSGVNSCTALVEHQLVTPGFSSR